MEDAQTLAASRLFAPVAIHFAEAIPIAVLGLGVNAASAWLPSGSQHGHHHGHHGHDHIGHGHSGHGHSGHGHSGHGHSGHGHGGHGVTARSAASRRPAACWR